MNKNLVIHSALEGSNLPQMSISSLWYKKVVFTYIITDSWVPRIWTMLLIKKNALCLHMYTVFYWMNTTAAVFLLRRYILTFQLLYALHVGRCQLMSNCKHKTGAVIHIGIPTSYINMWLCVSTFFHIEPHSTYFWIWTYSSIKLGM